MDFNFLSPVSNDLIEELEELHPSCIGKNILLHTAKNTPDLEGVKIALIGVKENRREQNKLTSDIEFTAVRKAFYSLFPGNWHSKIADLGNILPGEEISDTEYALKETLESLLEKNIIPIILGGSQDLTYAQYRAYDNFDKMVNLVNIDARFDIGNTDSEMSDLSYVGKMIVNKPYNLFNYANIGYQSYLNPPDEIKLIDQLHFEAYRLGDATADITLNEPVLRDADFISLDINSVAESYSNNLKSQPNGFSGKEICALARYAGLNNKLTSFGVYNLHNLELIKKIPLLSGEILWYFIEGVNFRVDEKINSSKNNFLKYSVPLDNEVLVFYKSKLSEKWWIEIPIYVNNKLKKHTFLPCSHEDYLQACKQEIPARWYKSRLKNEI